MFKAVFSIGESKIKHTNKIIFLSDLVDWLAFIGGLKPILFSIVTVLIGSF